MTKEGKNKVEKIMCFLKIYLSHFIVMLMLTVACSIFCGFVVVFMAFIYALLNGYDVLVYVLGAFFIVFYIIIPFLETISVLQDEKRVDDICNRNKLSI